MKNLIKNHNSLLKQRCKLSVDSREDIHFQINIKTNLWIFSHKANWMAVLIFYCSKPNKSKYTFKNPCTDRLPVRHQNHLSEKSFIPPSSTPPYRRAAEPIRWQSSPWAGRRKFHTHFHFTCVKRKWWNPQARREKVNTAHLISSGPHGTWSKIYFLCILMCPAFSFIWSMCARRLFCILEHLETKPKLGQETFSALGLVVQAHMFFLHYQPLTQKKDDKRQLRNDFQLRL